MVELCLIHCDSIHFYPMVWVWLLKYKSEIMLIFCTLKRLCIDTCFFWCLKEFCKAFSSFSNTERESLHRLFLQVCTLDMSILLEVYFWMLHWVLANKKTVTMGWPRSLFFTSSFPNELCSKFRTVVEFQGFPLYLCRC